MSRDVMRVLISPRQRRSIGFRCASGLASLVIAVGCTSDAGLASGIVGPYSGPGVSAPAASSITITPSVLTLTQGDSGLLTASVQSAGGGAINNPAITWSSGDSSVAVVSNTGSVRSVGAGQAIVTASAGGVAAQATVVVQPLAAPNTVTNLAVVPTSDSSVAVTFTAVDNGSGQPAGYDLRYAAGTVDWTSASSVTQGSCMSPVIGPSIGSTVQCTVLGLSPSTAYQFQIVAFRGMYNVNEVPGALSGVRGATTPAAAGTPPTQSGGVVASVAVTPTWVSETVGQSSQLAAVVQDGSGKAMSGQSITWTSSAPSVAIVGSTGLVTAVGAGSATITASSGGQSGTSAITVAPAAAVAPSTVVNLAARSLSDSSATVTFTAVSDGTGQPASYDLRYAPGTMNWGSASSVSSGSCTTPISGSAIGSTVQCTALGLSPATAYQFQIVAFRGSLNGNAVFSALSNVAGMTTSAAPALPVNPPTVASVAVTPGSVSSTAGQTTQLTAVANDASGNAISGQTFTWTTSRSSVATVNGNGLMTAVGNGTATITASSNGKSGSATVTVSSAAPVVASVAVTPGSVNNAVGKTAQLTATVSDASGNTISGQTISWTSSKTSVATVNSSGLVTLVGAGAATVTASTGGQSGTASVTVTAAAPVVASVVVSPTSVSNTVGQTAQLSAVAEDASGNAISGQTISWTSSKTSVATVSASGLVTSMAAGTATITASTGGKNGTAAVTVAAGAPVVASVSVTPGSVGNTVGQTTQLAAAALSSSGASISGQSFTWTSSNSAVATVASSGLVTSVGVGTATITASSSGVTGTASLTVSAAPSSTPSSPPAVSSTEPMPGTGTTIWADNFDQYASTAAMTAAYVYNTTSWMSLDKTGGIGGSQAFRIDWQTQSGCADASRLVEQDFAATTEIYATYEVRYTPGFAFDWIYSGYSGCAGNAKKLFLIPSISGSRLQLIAENHHIVLYTENQLNLMTGQPGIQNVGAEFSLAQLADGNWHRITIHAKMSSTPTADDGFLYGWIDGNLKWSNPAYATGNTGGWYVFQVPSVINQGSPQNQTEWMDNINVWHP